VVPQLVRRHRDDRETSDARLISRWLAGLAVSDDPSALAQAVDRLCQQGLDAGSLQLDWLAPAARELGAWWERDDCSFSDVTVGLVRLQCAARRLSPLSPTPETLPDGRPTPRILLLAAPGEQHGFGLTLVADAFRRAGWDVGCAAGRPGLSPVEQVAQAGFDVVGVSVGSTPRTAGLRRLCADLRRASSRPGIAVLLGGPIFSTGAVSVDPDDWGADAVAMHAQDAVVTGWQLLAATQLTDDAAPPSRPTG
jgi:methanogenic corrinoid protein MtbC1